MTNKAIVDNQDPLPESNFTWRRIFTFVVIGVLLYFVHEFAHDIAEVAKSTGSEQAIDRLAQIIRFLIYFAALAHVSYMLAPSAEQLMRIFQAAATLRSGVGFKNAPEKTGWLSRKRTKTDHLPVEPPTDRDAPPADLDPENMPPPPQR